MNEPYRLRYTNQIVGLFMLVVLLFVILLFVVLRTAGDFLSDRDVYWVEGPQEEVSDLLIGADVMILGERAGTVQGIDYVEQSDRVRVELGINPEMSKQIFQDSYVQLQRKFGVGTPMLVIRRKGFSTKPLVPLASGNRLGSFQGESDRIDQMSQELESVTESIRLIQQQLSPTLADISNTAERFSGSLQNSVDPAFVSVGQASKSVYHSSEAIRPETLETLRAVRLATENLESRVESLTNKIEAMVEDDIRGTLEEVRESSNDISDVARSIDQATQSVNTDVTTTLVTLRDAAEQVQQLALETRDLVRIVRKEAEQLPGTTQRVNDTVHDAQAMVGEIRSHWLLRRYSGQGNASEQVSPSSVRGGTTR